MTRSTLTDHYGSLTAEERFKLIFQAGARGDEDEQNVLLKNGKRVTISLADHAPTALAYSELAGFYYTEVIEAAQRFRDHEQQMIAMILRHTILEQTAPDSPRTAKSADSAPVSARRLRPRRSSRSRKLENKAVEILMAVACQYRQLVRGWVQFSRDLGVPPFAFWKPLSGFPRIRATWKATKGKAFSPRGHMNWLNRIRPKNAEPVTTPPCTAEFYRQQIEQCYRQCQERFDATMRGGTAGGGRS